MIPRIHNVHLFVSQMDRAVAFYRDTLGLSLRFSTPYWAEFEVDGFTLGLQYAGDGAPVAGGGAVVDFEVQDIETMIERLEAAQAKFVAVVLDQPFGKIAKFRDSEGNLLGLFEQLEAFA